MKLVDANILLYAVNTDAPHHDASSKWLDTSLIGDETIGLPWLCLIAFTRLATRPSIFPHPLPVADALDQVAAWLSAPAAIACNPGASHVQLWRESLLQTGSGNLVNDAHLAALALEHRAIVVTYDTDFARFPGVSWQIPEQLLIGH